jgi:hypothetical protein
MLCCFKPQVTDPAHTAERHYSLAPSNSMAGKADKDL